MEYKKEPHELIDSQLSRVMFYFYTHQDCSKITLKREPIEENLEDLAVSSGSGGKRPATKEHLEVPNKSWCSGTT